MPTIGSLFTAPRADFARALPEEAIWG